MDFKKLSRIADSLQKVDYSREIEAIKKYAETAEDGKFKEFVTSKSFDKFTDADWHKAFKLMQKDQKAHGQLPTIFYHEEYDKD